MKRFIFLSCFLIPAMLHTSSQSLPTDNTTGRVTYEGIIEVSNTSKEHLLEAVIEWITGFNAFRGNFNALYLNNEKGIIKSGISLNISQTFKTSLWYTNCNLFIEASENKLLYRITDFYTYMSLSAYRNLLLDDVSFESELEKSSYFKIHDISQSEITFTLDKQINRIIDSLKSTVIKN